MTAVLALDRPGRLRVLSPPATESGCSSAPGPDVTGSGQEVIESIRGGTTGDLAALLDGAATLSRAGNRLAAIAALLSAVGLAPNDRTAHRRLAAAYAVAGDRDSARSEYERFITRLEAHGSFDAAILERTYARVVLALPAARLVALPAPVRDRITPTLNRDRSFALRRVAVAVVAIAATFGAMFAAGAQIFASGGPL